MPFPARYLLPLLWVLHSPFILYL